MEWNLLNAGKIFSYKVICRFFHKFAKHRIGTEDLENPNEDNGTLQSKVKQLRNKIGLLTGEETIKEDEMARLIAIKVLLSKQPSRLLANLQVPELDWSEL